MTTSADSKFALSDCSKSTEQLDGDRDIVVVTWRDDAAGFESCLET